MTARWVKIMRINTWLYSIKQGFMNIFRNKMFSLASIATMAACIFMFGIFYILVTNFSNMVKEVESGVAVTVFFDDGIPEEQILDIQEEIKKKAEVSKVNYISATDAWEKFKEFYFEGQDELAEGFADDNPLANDASLEIYLNDVSMQKTLVSSLKKMEGIREVNESREVANMLNDFNHLISYVSMGITLILLGVAIFLISNTVTVGISVRKEEIGIMKLIGATDYLVRAPFLVEGIIIGLVGAAIPLVLLHLLYREICEYIVEKFSFIGTVINFIPTETVFKTLVPIALILGVGIGFLGSRFTIHKHLKV